MKVVIAFDNAKYSQLMNPFALGSGGVFKVNKIEGYGLLKILDLSETFNKVTDDKEKIVYTSNDNKTFIKIYKE